jgi:hypothetical protein
LRAGHGAYHHWFTAEEWVLVVAGLVITAVVIGADALVLLALNLVVLVLRLLNSASQCDGFLIVNNSSSSAP